MPQSFDSAIALERVALDEHRFTLPDGWQQGRGAFGGLVVGALLDAMIAREEDGTRAPRAFMGDLCAPALPKASRILTRVLRRGNNQTNLAASLEQDGTLVAHGTCVLASPRKVSEPPRLPLDPPPRTPFDASPIAPQRPFVPSFAQHYEYRPTGPVPFAGGAEAIVLGWVRERVPLARVTAAAMLARLDAYWPATFSVEKAPRPMTTVSFMAELLVDPASLDPTTPLFYRGRTVAQSGGYCVELRELWHGDQPVAMNQQSFAMLA